ncbi:MAG: transposase [Acidobacteriota bacterium]
MAETRKHFSPEAKVAILKEHLIGKVPVADLCDKHGMHPNVFWRWQKEFFENGAAAFEGQNDGKSPKLERRITPAHLSPRNALRHRGAQG